ncbi:MAG TPA: sulfate ABC transporter substrate-binding protein [Methylocella sp.]|nr:sulfate ABC transporter substrate-binding protein [Methylocella sp.]
MEYLALGLILAVLPRPGWSADVKLLNASYDPTRELYDELNSQFADYYKNTYKVTVAIDQSHAGSSKQARSVIDGLKADVVTLGCGWDITAIEKAGLILPGWQNNQPYNAAPYTSTVSFLVRKGNPKHIKDWSDLIRPDVRVITPNPKTSAAGRWNFLALWGAVAKAKTHDLGTESGLAESLQAAGDAKSTPVYQNAEARAAIETFFNHNVPVLDTGARGATVTFAQKQLGDVLLNWENELWLAIEEFGSDKFDIVYPSTSILAEPPVAVVDEVVDEKKTRRVAEAYVKFLYTPEAQETAAELHYRPRDVNVLKQHSADLPPLPLFTIDETFGGWERVQNEFFNDGALFDRIYRPSQ